MDRKSRLRAICGIALTFSGSAAAPVTHAQSLELGAKLEDLNNSGATPPGIAPPAADPRDIEGVWLPFQDRSGAPPPGKAPPGGPGLTGASAVERPPAPLGLDLLANDENRPYSVQQCSPMRVFGGAFNIQIVQTPTDAVLIGEDAEYARIVRIGGRHPAKPTYQQNGDSIGHWEGNTLVVDTIGIAGQGGKPLTALHIVERIKKIDGGRTVDIETTTQLGNQPPNPPNRTTGRWRPDMHLAESICEEGFAHFHLVNGKLEIDDEQ